MCRRAYELSQIQDAFSPSPLTTKDELEEFYLKTAFARTGDEYSDFVRNISLQLENCREVHQHKLFIGHPGCGKTTELYQLQQVAREAGFVVGFGRCDLDLDSADIEYTDVLFLILDLLVHIADDNDFELDAGLIQSIHDYWETDIEISKNSMQEEELKATGRFTGKVGLTGILEIFAQVKGVIKNSSDSRRTMRKHIEPKSSELIDSIQKVIDKISQEAKKYEKKQIPLIILDGLDKIPLDQARKIFRENGSRFSTLNVHLIVTFPIALTYTPEFSDILTWFPDSDKLPMIKLRKWDTDTYVEGYHDGMDTMIQIVKKRADLSLFDENVLEYLITYTGGYIRDLFRCISRAALRAQIRGSASVSMKDAGTALDNLESDINGRYADSMISVMKRIYNGEKYVSSSNDMTQLLQVGAVLEYNGERWCDLHPLVEKWLKDHNKI
jgi:hypothetical protein